MAYCAVSMRSESGDDYVFLIDYKTPEEIKEKLKQDLGEELGYIYTWLADCDGKGLNAEEVEAVVGDAIEEQQQDNEE